MQTKMRASRMGMLVISLAACLSSITADKVDLADWSSNSWSVRVDGVMGGKSSGNLERIADGVVFSGSISLDGGGFSNIRRSFSTKNLAGYAGLWVEVDMQSTPTVGVTMQLQDKNDEFEAVFAVPQDTQGSGRASVFLPWSSFGKKIRFRERCNGCTLDPSTIKAVAVYILYQSGPFAVTLRNIYAVQSSADIPVATPVIPSMTMTDEAVRSMIETSIARGVTAWNKDQPEICGAIYDCTMWTIRKASGPAAGVLSVALAATDMAAPYDFNVDEAPAWIYRRGFDTIVNAYDQKPFPPESDYPTSAGGAWATEAIGRADAVPRVNSTDTGTAEYTSAANRGSSYIFTAPYAPLMGVMGLGLYALAACVNMFAIGTC